MPGHVIPLDLRDLEGEIEISGQMIGPLRFGVPSLVAPYGTMKATGDRVYVFAYEWPEAFTGLDKQATEIRHMARFARDLEKGTGSDTYRDAKPGGDPPDFAVEMDGNEVGVEVTQLVNEKRRSSAKIFEQVRRGVLKSYLRDFRHLQGHVVYIGFDGKRPPVKDADIAKVVEAIKHVRPIAEEELGKEQLDDDFAREFEGGRMTAAPANGIRQSGIAGALGFDIGLAYTSILTVSEAGKQLTDLVKKKDTPGNDELLIAIGAPTQDGLAYPSDAVLAYAALEFLQDVALDTKFLTAIYLHLWDDEAVYRLTPGQPGFDHLCGRRPDLP